MKKIFVLFLMISAFSFGEIVNAKVTAVLGGASVQVLIGDKKQNAVLYGITAPGQKEKWGPQSKQYLNSLILNKNVKLDVKSKGKSGLTVVLFSGKENINMKLISNGHAKSNGKDKKFAKAQEKAKKEKFGMWKEDERKEIMPKDGTPKKKSKK